MKLFLKILQPSKYPIMSSLYLDVRTLAEKSEYRLIFRGRSGTFMYVWYVLYVYFVRWYVCVRRVRFFQKSVRFVRLCTFIMYVYSPFLYVYVRLFPTFDEI